MCQPTSRVLDLAPGRFCISASRCDEPLNLSIGHCDVAVGETVKVGDKFGLRLSPRWSCPKKNSSPSPPSRRGRNSVDWVCLRSKTQRVRPLRCRVTGLEPV